MKRSLWVLGATLFAGPLFSVACSGSDDEGGGGNGGQAVGGKGGGGVSGSAGSGGQANAGGSGGGGTSGSGGTAGTGGQAESSSDVAKGNYNNQGTITGATFGGLESASQVRKEVPVTLSAPSPDFELGKAYVTKFGRGARILLSVTNKSKTFHCFLKAKTLKLKDASGGLLGGEEDGPYITGSVGADNLGFVDTCLGPDEMGYFLELKLDLVTSKDLFSLAKSIEIEIEPADFKLTRPAARVLPQGYTVGMKPTLGAQELKIDVKNEGTVAVKIKAIGSYSKALAFDAGGTVLDWDYVTDSVLNENVAAGQTSRITGAVDFAAPVSKIRVFIDYDDPLSKFSALPQTGRDGLANKLLNAHESWTSSQAKLYRLSKLAVGRP